MYNFLGQVHLGAHVHLGNPNMGAHQRIAHAVVAKARVACDWGVEEQRVGAALFELFGSMLLKIVGFACSGP